MAGDSTQAGPLVDYLAGGQSLEGDHTWQGWQIRPVRSGNNRLYRATGPAGDWAVKLMIRDDRDRARREFNSLTLLDRLGAAVAPGPIFCDPDHAGQPVVVQTWVEGISLWSPPDDDATWLKILEAYRRVHAISSAAAERAGLQPGPLLGPFAPDEQVAGIVNYARQIPPTGQPERLTELIEKLQSARFPSLPHTRCWAHGDPNVRNVVLAPNGARLVDWEYSGIDDPAHEIARLMSHALVAVAGEARFWWLADQYTAVSDEPEMIQRIGLHYALSLASWYVRLLFGYYVLLQRPSRRLVGHGPEAEISTLENIDRYFARSMEQLALYV